MKRVFKTKTFSRWARKVVDDSALCHAAREIEQGLFEADLGGGLCKKRIALGLQLADAQKLEELLAAEILKEICNVP